MREDISLEGAGEAARAESHVDDPPYAYRFAAADTAARRRRAIGLAVTALVIAAAGAGYLLLVAATGDTAGCAPGTPSR